MSINDHLEFINSNIDSWLARLREVVEQAAGSAS